MKHLLLNLYAKYYVYEDSSTQLRSELKHSRSRFLRITPFLSYAALSFGTDPHRQRTP